MSDYLKPAGFILLPHLGGILGGLATKREVSGKTGSSSWYQSLKKPWYQPPRWVFGPVWTTLYTSMGYASYMVWRDGGGFQGAAALPLACYGTQLAFNWAFSPIFFKYHKLGLASLNNFTLWGAVLATIITFNKVNPTAAYLLIPYLGWVTLASTLTFNIWRNNKVQVD